MTGLTWFPLFKKFRVSENSRPTEQEGQGGRQSLSSFLPMCPLFRRALEIPFLEEVTKNVHEI